MSERDDFSDFDEMPDDEYDPLDECALMDDGQCGHAGTEHCDFECPMRNSIHFAGNPGFRPRRRASRKP